MSRRSYRRRQEEGGLKAERVAWARALTGLVMKWTSADHHLARHVAHCLASSPSSPRGKAELKGMLQEFWEDCIVTWKEDMEGCCDDCQQVLALMREAGVNAL